MDGYSVGNLQLEIQAIENSTAKSLSTITRRLNSLRKSILGFEALDGATLKMKDFFNSLNNTLASVSEKNVSSLNTISRSIKRFQSSLHALTETQTVMAGSQIELLFDRISTSVAKIDTTKIEKFASISKSLSSLTKVSKIENIDFAKASKGFSQLATAIDPFIEKVKSAESSLIALDGVLKKTNMKTIANSFGGGGTINVGKNLEKSFNIAGILGKIYFIRNYTKQLGQSISNLVQMGIDYAETLNLWQVAMRGNISTAEEFISKMNKAYGIAEETLMRYQATFRNMLSTLGGISPDTSYALSEYLTQMALDYASLYNTSVDKAMTVFQSVLSGQVRPIRSISGYDITETTIYELYQQLGGTKTMRQLTQTEKRLLRIYAVFQQMDSSNAIGDLSFTLNSTANTTRVLSETLKDLGTYIGLLADKYLAPLITKVTAFAITAKNVVQVFANPIIEEKKKELERYGLTWDDTASGIDGATKSYEEFTGKLLGFDKFRSLSGGDQLGLGIDSSLIEGLSQYDSILEGTQSKVTDLANEWTSWWVDSEDGGLTKQAERFLTVLKAVGVALGGISTLALGNKISSMGKGLNGVSKSLTSVKDSIALISLAKDSGLSLSDTAKQAGEVSSSVLSLSKILKFMVSPLGIILSLATYLFATNEEFKTSITTLANAVLKPFLTILGVAVNILGGLLNVANAIIQPIGTIIGKTINLLDTIGLLEPLLYSIMVAIGLLKLKSLITDLGGIVTITRNVWASISLCAEHVKKLATTNLSSWANSIKTSLSNVNKQAMLTKTVGIGGLVAGITGLLYVVQNWGELGTWQKVIGLLSALSVACLGAAMAFGAFHSAWSIGLATAGIVAGIAGIAAVIATSRDQINSLSIDAYANGGMPDKGTMFVAGEAGAEMVYNTPSGQSGVANIQQIQQAMYGALVAYGNTQGNKTDNKPIDIYIDGEKVFQATKKNAKRHGLAFAKV